MIVKKIKNQNTPKPKTKQIADLVDYIRQPHNTNPAEKIEHSGGRHFLAENHASQRMEMIALATETVHSKMPVSHFVFSWREYEQPTADQVNELVDIFLREMGLEGCQTIYGLHYNTENYHVHIAVNRMHPVTMKVIDPSNGFDIEAAHKVLALVEHRQGWKPETNARYTVNEVGEVVLRPRRNAAPRPKQPALDFECATGEKSAQRIAQGRGHVIIQNAKSWPELHEGLAAVGLRFEKKGSGAIIFVGDIAVKASSVDRAFSMGKLCKRLGEFVLGDYPEERKPIAPEPVSLVNLKQWQQYRAERGEETSPASPTPEESPEIRLLREKHHRERATLHTRLGRPPRCILNIARHCLKLQQREEKRQMRHKTKATNRPRSGKQRFEDWLRERGMDRQADQWRYRQKLETIPPNLWEAPPLLKDQKYDPLKAYAAHRRAILQVSPEMEWSPSRLDSLIAMCMRKRGFKREDIVTAILHCAPEAQAGQETRNWSRYAERVANYAFGLPGELWLAQGAELQKQAQKKRETEEKMENAPREVPRMRFR